MKSNEFNPEKLFGFMDKVAGENEKEPTFNPDKLFGFMDKVEGVREIIVVTENHEVKVEYESICSNSNCDGTHGDNEKGRIARFSKDSDPEREALGWCEECFSLGKKKKKKA